MIALNNKIINQTFHKIAKNYQKDINNVENNIENIKNFSEILEILSINKLKNEKPNLKDNILYYLKVYESILIINDYSNFKCPLCKKEHTLTFHKTYERNIIFHLNGYEIIAIIKLIVLECSYCKKYNHNKQHYHAIIPDYIFPYHIYSSNIIMNCLIDHYLNELIIQEIIEQANISHQLYYKWLNEFNRYSLISSIILQTKNDIKEILKEIINRLEELQHSFYQNYNHPYFLFKKTCVSLVMTP